MADKAKLTVEKVGTPKEASAGSSENKTKIELLREEAVSLGMAKGIADAFESEELLSATVETLRANKPVASLKEVVDPAEESRIEKKWKAKAQRQKEYFNSLPQVRILIPCEGSEKPGVVEERVVNGIRQTVVISGAVWEKNFNGYKVIVPKGVYTTVSEAVADNIAKEFNQVQEGIQRFGLDRIDPVTGRPVRDQL